MQNVNTEEKPRNSVIDFSQIFNTPLLPYNYENFCKQITPLIKHYLREYNDELEFLKGMEKQTIRTHMKLTRINSYCNEHPKTQLNPIGTNEIKIATLAKIEKEIIDENMETPEKADEAFKNTIVQINNNLQIFASLHEKCQIAYNSLTKNLEKRVVKEFKGLKLIIEQCKNLESLCQKCIEYYDVLNNSYSNYLLKGLNHIK